MPCIETTAGGKIRCTIRATEACQSKPGRYRRVACPEYANCVDAGDDNAFERAIVGGEAKGVDGLGRAVDGVARGSMRTTGRGHRLPPA